ncbi:LysO family transporter [Craterilacuibacter sp. RT1T]|uniref:LysO family transporter n=1 Tax=Craterilacuibacter sp. RT1T TaxID=2942211 RepID=UPI0020BDF827|nr:LysO family transporter [Craterilacuibacter sp. RT1T]MCL6262842.1 LysO family transporter [Craterilacuibacter sp. RT1T]
MLSVIACLFAGVIAGHFLRDWRPVRHIGRLISLAIFLLLFLLGLSVGGNEAILSNLSTIGVTGVVISLASTMGSVLASWWVYVRFFRKDEA